MPGEDRWWHGRRKTLGPLACVVGLFALGAGPARAQVVAPPAYGTYAWPVRGPVLRGFQEPAGPYGPGHRGIDIGATLGTPVAAAQEGVVAFSGWVGGSLFLSIDHPDGVRTTYSWLTEVSVRRGDPVGRGQAVARTGAGHPGLDPPHLHFGARVGEVYIDPMLLLERGSLVGLVHLAPLAASPGSPEPAAVAGADPFSVPRSGAWAREPLLPVAADRASAAALSVEGDGGRSWSGEPRAPPPRGPARGRPAARAA